MIDIDSRERKENESSTFLFGLLTKDFVHNVPKPYPDIQGIMLSVTKSSDIFCKKFLLELLNKII